MADPGAKEAEAGLATGPPPPYQPTAPTAPSYGSQDTPSPPSYENSDPTEPPPSYESLYGQVRAARQESSSCVDFFKKFLVILLGTIGCTIIVGLVLAIPISMIAIGAKYVYSCPAERYIPIYLIVGGVFGVLKNLGSLGQRVKNRQSDQDDENAKTNPVDSLLNCFLLAWFIAGNVWIYRTFNNFSTDSTKSNFCDPVLYYFAFWVTTATYILIGCVCLCICCGGILGACLGGNDGS